ncbi:ADP-ribosylglycohydrolase family protein [Luminiphilus sp.]|nr:ADP-ribosylglycohydrolase family protein [Luminiphilus sp.]
MTYQDLLIKSRACLLGGAIGDALGAPVEFMSEAQIRAQFGERGLTDMVPAYGKLGAITDDTQMMLFTAEGLLRGRVRGIERGITSYEGCVHHAYMRWLLTQGYTDVSGDVGKDGWLFTQAELFDRRAPGNTCLGALSQFKPYGTLVSNDSKGCGGVMRVAPVGIFWLAQFHGNDLCEGATKAFETGCATGALTHGHPTGSIAAGVLAEIIFWQMSGLVLRDCLERCVETLRRTPSHDETLESINAAIRLASSGISAERAINELGEGWVAEEALAIGVFCALTSPTFEEAVLSAINHGGDSDSTGLIAGHLAGIRHGISRIPERWINQLELRQVISDIACDLVTHTEWSNGHKGSGYSSVSDTVFGRYPGW